MGYIMGGLIQALILGFVCDRIVSGKGYPRNENHGFLWGFLLSVIGVIVCACKPAYPVLTNNQNQYSSQKREQASSADALLKYKQLLDSGVLTQEEFDRKKEELLR